MPDGDTYRGRRVLVSGAASGIGRACALGFAESGARVGALDLDPAVCELLTGSNGHVCVRADVGAEPSVRAAIERVAARLGGIDVVVGAAGISGPFGAAVDEIDVADWDRVFNVNVTGQFLLVKHALPLLRRADRPAVVFIGSDSAFAAAEGLVPYCASKGALAQLTRALAVQLRPDGIRVCSVCPSVVDTPLSRADLGEQLAGGAFPVQTAEQVAGHVHYLASRAAATLSGVNLVSDFGYLGQSSFPA